MRDIAQATIIGNLTRDPEVAKVTRKRDGEQVTVAKFSIASNFDEEASFFDIEAWGYTAEAIDKFLSKGKRVAIVARIKQDKWTDKKTGENRYAVRFVASEVQFLTPKGEDGQSSGNGSTSRPSDHRKGMDPASVASEDQTDGW